MHITILNREFLLKQKRQEYDMCVFPFVHWLGKSKSMLYYLGKKKGRTVVVGAEESFTYTKRKEKVGCIHIQKRRVLYNGMMMMMLRNICIGVYVCICVCLCGNLALWGVLK